MSLFELQAKREGMWEPFGKGAVFSSLEEALQAVRDMAYHAEDEARWLLCDELRLRGPWRVLEYYAGVCAEGRWEDVERECTCGLR